MMVSDKPELIVFSQYLLGGGASFHRNMLANMPENNFDLKVVYFLPKHSNFTNSLEFVSRKNDVIFEYGQQYDNLYKVLKKLSVFITDKPGAVVTSLGLELYCLILFPKPNKTIYFICHDDGFLYLVKKFSHIIDVFITHNVEIFQIIKRLVPDRQADVYFIPHGVSVQDFERVPNNHKKLKIAYLARHHVLKGLYDLPLINQKLLDKNVMVDWLVMGDGPEKANFTASVSHLSNFSFEKPLNNTDVLEKLKEADIFILPSRKDGLPVALLEAMSVGCVPVLSNFSEGIKKVVTKEVGFIVDVGDNDSFADVIADLHQHRVLLRDLSKNTKQVIQQSFDIKSRAVEYFDLYNHYLLHKKTSSPQFFKRVFYVTVLTLSKIYYFPLVSYSRKFIYALKKRLS